MEQKNNIITINSQNIYQVRAYVKAVKELNRFVKDNMSKWYQEQLSIAPVIADFHKEADVLERDLNKFQNNNVVNCIKKDGYYYGKFSCAYHEQYIHVISVAGKNVIYEAVTLYSYTDGKSFNVDASENIAKKNKKYGETGAKDFAWKVMDGTLKEITKEEFDTAVDKYTKMSEIFNS